MSGNCTIWCRRFYLWFYIKNYGSWKYLYVKWDPEVCNDRTVIFFRYITERERKLLRWHRWAIADVAIIIIIIIIIICF